MQQNQSTSEKGEIQGPRLCLGCRMAHIEYMSQNYRVAISVAPGERPFSDKILDEQLAQVFNVHCYQYKKSIKRIIGDEILFPQARRVFFPSQLVSIYLSNALDLLQSLSSLELIARKVVKNELLSDNKLLLAVQNYDLWKGQAYIGGLFPWHFLLNGCVYVSVYDNIKHSLEMQSFSYIQRALQRHGRVLGQDLAEKIQKKVNALLVLLGHDHVDNMAPPQQILVNQESHGRGNAQSPFPDLNNLPKMHDTDAASTSCLLPAQEIGVPQEQHGDNGIKLQAMEE
ncbi:hypothetical protein SUGI_0190180 [Cryptomeria japonica]|nr:hypothetical protein SUGI_0190180 [Cryptomeria japonica]